MVVINGSNGRTVDVTSDNRIVTLSASEPFMHVLAEIGKAWTLPFTQTGAANTTDNAVFHMKNDSDDTLDLHFISASSAEAGLWSIYYGREYSSGGTAVTLKQLNTLSGKTQELTANYGTALTLTGTATQLMFVRVKADTPVDLLQHSQALQLEPSGTVEIRFQADAGNNVMAVNVLLHGEEPWE